MAVETYQHPYEKTIFHLIPARDKKIREKGIPDRIVVKPAAIARTIALGGVLLSGYLAVMYTRAGWNWLKDTARATFGEYGFVKG